MRIQFGKTCWSTWPAWTIVALFLQTAGFGLKIQFFKKRGLVGVTDSIRPGCFPHWLTANPLCINTAPSCWFNDRHQVWECGSTSRLRSPQTWMLQRVRPGPHKSSKWLNKKLRGLKPIPLCTQREGTPKTFIFFTKICFYSNPTPAACTSCRLVFSLLCKSFISDLRFGLNSVFISFQAARMNFYPKIPSRIQSTTLAASAWRSTAACLPTEAGESKHMASD